ncbi:hypothetical protein DNTS_031543 [Danionella cerebrum]|uniref:Synaptogyrin n=1 Tax=Danionella cerebrum TaxID=2873325 RepID=A0A553R2T7_9TELE|nr:hypothetical protein DNTS_031543 [Danionella translucida]
MEQAYGAGKAGGTFDPITFFQQPPTILRILSWIFSLVIFGCIANEGYVNRPNEEEEFCIFNRNQNACNYAVGMGALDFLCCAAFMALDVYFPQISSVKDRKKAVLADIGVSAFWSFVWFVGFCFLANQWQVSDPEDNPLKEGGDAARAAITFAFFSIFTWGVLTLLGLERLKKVSFEEEYNKLFTPHTPPPFAGQAFFGFQKYKLGSSSSLFSQDYTDPSQDPAAAPPGEAEYTGYNADAEANYDGSGGYQNQDY